MNFPVAQPHGAIKEILSDVFFVTGTKAGPLMGSHWHFSRNMTILRDGRDLTLVNSVRLSEAGLLALEALGNVRHVVRLGALHGLDDGFYVTRYNAEYWSAENLATAEGMVPTRTISEGAAGPIANSTFFLFGDTNLFESILHIDRDGGILVACDALQNWCQPDEFFSEESRQVMTDMGFFQPANIGPVWFQVNEPKGSEFTRLQQKNYAHVFCGHGEPLLYKAKDAFQLRFDQTFSKEPAATV